MLAPGQAPPPSSWLESEGGAEAVSWGGRGTHLGETHLGETKLTWAKGPWSDFCLSARCLRPGPVGVATAGRSLGENKIRPIGCEPGLCGPGGAEQEVDGKQEEVGVVGVDGEGLVPAGSGGVTRPASLTSVAAVAASPLASRWSLMSSSSSCWEKVTQERATTSARCSPANDTSAPGFKRRDFPNTTAVSWAA